jgi:hypothetical protein
MRARQGSLATEAAWTVAFGVLLSIACGGPRYPNCENDSQCNGEGHHGVCLNSLCTECRDDAGCGRGKECRGGACSLIEDYCDDSHACAQGDCGKNHHCQKGDAKVASKPAVECDDFHTCAGKTHCENGHCVAPPSGGAGCTDFPAPHFDFESPELRPEGQQVLQRLAKCVTEGSLKGAHVLLTGHCDARGEYEYNMSLGAQRAETVRGFLMGLGLAGDAVMTSSRGKLDAVGSDETGWEKDRRVDIEVR